MLSMKRSVISYAKCDALIRFIWQLNIVPVLIANNANVDAYNKFVRI